MPSVVNSRTSFGSVEDRPTHRLAVANGDEQHRQPPAANAPEHRRDRGHRSGANKEYGN